MEPIPGATARIEVTPDRAGRRADAVLAASVFHFGIMKIGEVKDALREHGTEVR